MTSISIDKAEYKEDYEIELSFSDGVTNVIGFEDFLSESMNPVTTKYLDKKEFSNFQVEFGGLMWNDFEMCFLSGICTKGKYKFSARINQSFLQLQLHYKIGLENLYGGGSWSHSGPVF